MLEDNMEDREESTAIKRTSSDQRKLRSRDAARCRRSKETELFYDLARTLPLPRRVSTHLDKAAIMRVTLSFLRTRHLCLGVKSQGSSTEKEEKEEENEEEDPADGLYAQALSGFIVVITEEGDMIYLTENVNKHVGIPQLELLGQSVYDFVHPCDQEELRDLLSLRPGGGKKVAQGQLSLKNFFLRMKSTLTTRGRTVNIKSASWKVFHCTGHMRTLGDKSEPASGMAMTLLCEPVPHPSSVEFPLDTHTFLTRHSMDMRVTHCEGRVVELVGYEPDELIGHSVFEYHHALDSDHVNKSLHTLLAKGQVSTSPYRFLARGGGFVWAQTQATVLYSSKTSQSEAVVCLNFVLSAVEQSHFILSTEQLCVDHSLKAESSPSVACDSEHLNEDSASNPDTLPEARTTDKNLGLTPEYEEDDVVSPLTGDLVSLSFVTTHGPDSLPDHPQDLCTPQLRQLLSPIFNPITPPPSPSSSSSSDASSPQPQPVQAQREESMLDTSEVEKLFAFFPEDGDNTQYSGQQVMDGMDLDMLAPYISMDDDFQLTFFSGMPEDASKPPASSSEPPAVNRKRAHNPDDDVLSRLMVGDKRHKHDPPTLEEEILLSHSLLGCLEETGLLEAGSGPQGRSHLLTDRDPIFGGMRGLCDTAALMKDIFKSHPPDVAPSLLPM
ncbi:hypoxia-inducible factor 1-alpha-like isoform X1 [Nerophis ophidion]|uniref:hypoxia inducible factor 1 subunit alpha, like isoform X1 n=3 Tax=Nerophis ophidion TaxID=159077 RepID=UPI002AE009B7|nr:hypoxia inducible factor 1 subunit alpha, like isoform X1 [Nerophis ophidion]XP_061749460.1 hypoxia-inducible factor 1-alpha-like isoform X1 [Nerophis ophidion]